MKKDPGQKVVHFVGRELADLHVDAIYLGGTAKHFGASPLSKLIGVGTSGGFRSIVGGNPRRVTMCALVTSGINPDWPDNLDVERGVFTYYGDNRKAGTHDMHDTKLKGNGILRDSFSNLHLCLREHIPVFLVFEKVGRQGYDYKFLGLAVPGANGLGPSDDLVAIWKSNKKNQRFLNYRSRFTILNCPTVSKAWIHEIKQTGEILGPNCPQIWKDFVKSGHAPALMAPKSKQVRTKEDQLPESKSEWEVLNTLVAHYKAHPDREYAFERCAIEVCKLSDPKIIDLELTPPTRDGGRDGIGVYRLGTDFSYIKVEFSMEAKCYDPQNSNGVQLTSRLISRLRHRQFGYFVTTSFVGTQAYNEIVDDNHPVVIFSGRDIARILIEQGYNSETKVLAWLTRLDLDVVRNRYKI
jgi:hypothetical protein